MTNKSEKANNLDLGLSALLQEVSAAPASSPETHEATPPQTDAIDSQLKPEVKKNKYEELADSQNWPELANVCESELRSNPENVTEVRLWWVLAQLKGRRMPATLLTAPLETATQELKNLGDKPDLINLAARTLAELGQALLAAGDGAAAVSFLKRAADLVPQHAESLQSAALHEIKRLESLNNLSTRQLAERDQQLSSMRAFIPSQVEPPELRILADLKRSAAIRKTQAQGESKNRGGRSTAFSFLSALRSSVLVRVLPIVIFLGLISAFLLPRFSSWFESSPGAMIYRSSRNTAAPTLKLPELSKLDSVSAFDGLYYDLKTERPGAPVAGGALRSRVASPATKVTATISGSKEVLSMSGPAEPQEMRQALSQPQQALPDKSSDILFGGGATKGGSPGAPSSAPSTSGSAEPQELAASKVYRIIARTRITASPSYQTEVLGTLQTGERVAAEGRVDSWIQIRSASGRIGFILAQDAVPEG